MAPKCCVPGCKSNYDSINKIDPKSYVSVFKFPSDAEMREKWINSIRRKDWSPSNTSVVCRKHFQVSDIILSDAYIDQLGVMRVVPRKNPALKQSAVPTIFPGLPSCLFKKSQQMAFDKQDNRLCPARPDNTNLGRRKQTHPARRKQTHPACHKNQMSCLRALLSAGPYRKPAEVVGDKPQILNYQKESNSGCSNKKEQIDEDLDMTCETIEEDSGYSGSLEDVSSHENNVSDGHIEMLQTAVSYHQVLKKEYVGDHLIKNEIVFKEELL